MTIKEILNKKVNMFKIYHYAMIFIWTIFALIALRNIWEFISSETYFFIAYLVIGCIAFILVSIKKIRLKKQFIIFVYSIIFLVLIIILLYVEIAEICLVLFPILPLVFIYVWEIYIDKIANKWWYLFQIIMTFLTAYLLFCVVLWIAFFDID